MTFVFGIAAIVDILMATLLPRMFGHPLLGAYLCIMTFALFVALYALGDAICKRIAYDLKKRP